MSVVKKDMKRRLAQIVSIFLFAGICVELKKKMKLKPIVLMAILVTMISACRPHAASYASYEEYPVYEGAWEEI